MSCRESRICSFAQGLFLLFLIEALLSLIGVYGTGHWKVLMSELLLFYSGCFRRFVVVATLH